MIDKYDNQSIMEDINHFKKSLGDIHKKKANLANEIVSAAYDLSDAFDYLSSMYRYLVYFERANDLAKGGQEAQLQRYEDEMNYWSAEIRRLNGLISAQTTAINNLKRELEALGTALQQKQREYDQAAAVFQQWLESYYNPTYRSYSASLRSAQDNLRAQQQYLSELREAASHAQENYDYVEGRMPVNGNNWQVRLPATTHVEAYLPGYGNVSLSLPSGGLYVYISRYLRLDLQDGNYYWNIQVLWHENYSTPAVTIFDEHVGLQSQEQNAITGMNNIRSSILDFYQTIIDDSDDMISRQIEVVYDAEDEVGYWEDKIRDLEDEYDEHKEPVDDLLEEIREIQVTMASKQAEIDAAEDNQVALRNELSEARQKYDIAEKKYQDLYDRMYPEEDDDDD